MRLCNKRVTCGPRSQAQKKPGGFRLLNVFSPAFRTDSKVEGKVWLPTAEVGKGLLRSEMLLLLSFRCCFNDRKTGNVERNIT